MKKLTPRLKNELGFTLIELVMVILTVSIVSAVALPNFIDFRKDAKNGATQGALGALRQGIADASAAIALKEPNIVTPGATWNGSSESISNYYRYTYYHNYPTTSEVNSNALGVSDTSLANQIIHPNCVGIGLMGWINTLEKEKKVMQASIAGAFIRAMTDHTPVFAAVGVPGNPWSKSSYNSTLWIKVFECQNCTKGSLQVGNKTLYVGAGNSTIASGNIGWVYDPLHGEVWANTANNGGTASASAKTPTENYF